MIVNWIHCFALNTIEMVRRIDFDFGKKYTCGKGRAMGTIYY